MDCVLLVHYPNNRDSPPSIGGAKVWVEGMKFFYLRAFMALYSLNRAFRGGLYDAPNAAPWRWDEKGNICVVS